MRSLREAGSRENPAARDGPAARKGPGDLTASVISSELEHEAVHQFLLSLPLGDVRQQDLLHPRMVAREIRLQRWRFSEHPCTHRHVVTQCTDVRGCTHGVLVCIVYQTMDTCTEKATCNVQVRYAALAPEYRSRALGGMPACGRSWLPDMWSTLNAHVLQRYGGMCIRGALYPGLSTPWVRQLFLPLFQESTKYLGWSKGYVCVAECTFAIDSVGKPSGFGHCLWGEAAETMASRSQCCKVLDCVNFESSFGEVTAADGVDLDDVQISVGLRHCLCVTRLGTFEHMPVSHSTGVYSFVVDLDDCKKVHSFLSDHVCPDWEAGRAVKIGDCKFSGYSGYQITNRKFNARQQARRTLMAPTLEMRDTLLAYVPGLSNILEAVLTEIGLVSSGRELWCGFHILWQRDRLEGQASFSWHVDTKNVGSVQGKYKQQKPSRRASPDMLSCIVQLSETVSAMQMYLFKPHAYLSRGSAAVFNGGAVHHSVLCELEPDDTFKLVFFFSSDMD